MPKIPALPPLAPVTLADGDEFPINDLSASNTTKRSPMSAVKAYLAAATSWITTTMLANNAVTPIKTALFTNMPAVASVGSTSLGTSYTTLTNTDVTVPSGCNFVLAIAVVRLANGAATLGDLNAQILYENTTSYCEATITNAANFHGSMATLIYPIPVTSGTRNFKIQGKRTTTATANGFVVSAFYIPLG